MRYHRTAGYDKMSEAVGIAQQWRREDMRLYLHDYYRMVEKVDREMGRVLTALRESGLDRNTLVAFASDHGEGMGAHRWVQKAAFYEESVHVPLILNGPGVEPGVDHNLVTLADLLPTFCEAAGVAVPKDLAGASLFGPRERKFVVSELRYGDASREGRMLRTKRYKYVVFNTGARREQFFDLELDPGESFNLAGRSEARGLVGEHRQLMKDWISSRSDDFRLV
jgi:arylsulfatase A-like enzyme